MRLEEIASVNYLESLDFSPYGSFAAAASGFQ